MLGKKGGGGVSWGGTGGEPKLNLKQVGVTGRDKKKNKGQKPRNSSSNEWNWEERLEIAFRVMHLRGNGKNSDITSAKIPNGQAQGKQMKEGWEEAKDGESVPSVRGGIEGNEIRDSMPRENPDSAEGKKGGNFLPGSKTTPKKEPPSPTAILGSSDLYRHRDPAAG